MRRRTVIILAGFVMATLLITLSVQPQPARALQASIHKVKGDYVSIEASVSLIWENADDSAGRDWFRVKVYAQGQTNATPLAQFDEKITADQSPYYWVTHRVPALNSNGRYIIELWEINKNGKELFIIDQVVYDTFANKSWRGGDITGAAATHTPVYIQQDQIPLYPGCVMYMPIYTTNQAPEAGAVLVVWTGNPAHAEGVRDENIWYTFHVARGDYFTGHDSDGHAIPVPCGLYIRLYFQPDSTKQLYLMPSQYWPAEYGTGMQNNHSMMSYHTVFPLDGPPRTDAEAQPTSTPKPATATPIPTATPTVIPAAATAVPTVRTATSTPTS